MIRRPSSEAGLVIALVLVTSCDVLFPYGAAPGPRDLPDDHPVAVDVRNDRAADALTIDRADVAPGTDVGRDAVDARLTPWPDVGSCATWAAWSCPSSASYYCKASCGGMMIECNALSCTCSAGTKSCTNTPAGYCSGCQSALESGCCQ